MPCSDARLAANRANALKSTGPKTAEGKRIARQNSWRHGLTGAGVVVPGEDAQEIDHRASRFLTELAGDGSATTHLLAQRLAVLSVRIERAARHEFAATAERVRQAGAHFDEARHATARDLLDRIDADPAHLPQLQAMPEGVDLLMAALRTLRPTTDLDGESRWSEEQGQSLRRRLGPEPRSRCAALTAAIMTTVGDARAHAAGELTALIDGEIVRLANHCRTLDHAAIAAERAGVVALALVGDDPATLLARKYEAAIERSIFRALGEIRAQQRSAPAAAVADRPAELAQALAATHDQIRRLGAGDPARLGSFFPEPPPPRPVDLPAPLTAARPPRAGQSRYEDRKQRPRLDR